MCCIIVNSWCWTRCGPTICRVLKVSCETTKGYLKNIFSPVCVLGLNILRLEYTKHVLIRISTLFRYWYPLWWYPTTSPVKLADQYYSCNHYEAPLLLRTLIIQATKTYIQSVKLAPTTYAHTTYYIRSSSPHNLLLLLPTTWYNTPNQYHGTLLEASCMCSSLLYNNIIIKWVCFTNNE